MAKATDFTDDNDDFELPADAETVTGSYLNQDDEEITLITQEKLLDPGLYNALLTRIIGPKKNENTGNQQMQFIMFLTEPNKQGITKVVDFVTLTPESAWRQLEIAAAFAIPSDGQKATFKKSSLIGKAVILSIITDEYQGRKRDKVKNYMAPDLTAKKLAEKKWAELQ